MCSVSRIRRVHWLEPLSRDLWTEHGGCWVRTNPMIIRGGIRGNTAAEQIAFSP
ncbi:hypothetical protein EMPG_11037, partial [Blastomyces silverae]